MKKDTELLKSNIKSSDLQDIYGKERNIQSAVLSEEKDNSQHLRDRSEIYLEEEGLRTERLQGCKTGRQNEFGSEEGSLLSAR